MLLHMDHRDQHHRHLCRQGQGMVAYRPDNVPVHQRVVGHAVSDPLRKNPVSHGVAPCVCLSGTHACRHEASKLNPFMSNSNPVDTMQTQGFLKCDIQGFYCH